MSKCKLCGIDLPHTAPTENYGDDVICGDCAFISGIISEEKYVKKHLYWIALKGVRASVHEGKIRVTVKNKLFDYERIRNVESRD